MAYELPYTYETTEENPNKVTVENFFTCDQNESYKEGFLIRGAGSGLYPVQGHYKDYEEEAVSVSVFETSPTGRYCIIVPSREYQNDIQCNSDVRLNSGEEGLLLFTYKYNEAGEEPREATAGTIPGIIGGYDAKDTAYAFTTNIPVFKLEDKQKAHDYVYAATTQEAVAILKEYAINFQEAEFDKDTETYYIYNSYGSASYTRGEIGSPDSQVSRNIIFRANVPPVLYFDENTFQVYLKAPAIVDGYYSSNMFDAENCPVQDYVEGKIGSIDYKGPFYSNIDRRDSAGLPNPEDGTYNYGFTWISNINIFGSEEDAAEALATGDYSKSSNYYDIQAGNTVSHPPTFGQKETTTTFGGGSFLSPFIQSYVMSETGVKNIADAFYSNDTTLIDNIKKGLELFGASPFEALVGLWVFPFDVTNMVSTSPQTYVYFGSYQHTGVNVSKVINLAANYLNAGSVFIAPLFKSYRDLEPYTSLSVYLPFVGWQKLDIATYLNHTVNIRYYVDIYTGSGIVVLLADGVMVDYFTVASIGIQLPLTGQNMSEYANSALNSLLGVAGGVVGGAASGAMVSAGNPAGAIIGGLIGGAAGVAKGAFDMSQKAKPKDLNRTKGSYSGGSGFYMPRYVIFRYDIHDLIVPNNLTSIYGRPSSYGGKLGNLSGFVSCDTVKLNTNGMSEAEINELSSLLQSGIYV